MKKFELTTEFKILLGKKLFRIKALVSFKNVKEGELGGFVEKEENLDQSGNAWVSGDAEVSGNARVSGDAEVSGHGRVYGNAGVYGDAVVSGYAEVYGNAGVSGDAEVSGDARVSGDAEVYGDARVYGDADYTTIKGFGSVFRCTTFFREKDKNIGVKCGCFYGTLDDFRKKVVKTHGESRIAKEYLMIADLMEKHFEEK